MDTQSFFICILGIVGACIGSYLNVVIYRIPRGQSSSQPRRSYCPACQVKIPFYRNVPILTWMIQRGRCHACQESISFRYVIVEVLTCVLFIALWIHTPDWRVLISAVFVSLLIAISFIDAEHYIIPVNWCWLGGLLALFANVFCPTLISDKGSHLLDYVKRLCHVETVDTSFLLSLMGGCLGFIILQVVVVLGKLVFGTIRHTSEVAQPWFLKEPEEEFDELQFVYGETSYGWSDIFYRKSDRIEMESAQIKLDGKPIGAGAVTIRERVVTIDAVEYDITRLQSLEGQTHRVTIPREAMGGGDPPLLAMIGAFLGPYAVVYTLFSSSVFALLFAFGARLGFGKPLPYGPFLAMGAMSWIFGGDRIFQWYLSIVG